MGGLNKVLICAEDEAKRLMIQYPNKEMKAIFNEYGITRERFLQALSTVRGNQRVVSDNPEATYDTLNKYGEDLVEKARSQKLDPVIGRDMRRSVTLSVSCPVRQRTTRFLSVNPVSVKPPLWRVLHSVS